MPPLNFFGPNTRTSCQIRIQLHTISGRGSRGSDPTFAGTCNTVFDLNAPMVGTEGSVSKSNSFPMMYYVF